MDFEPTAARHFRQRCDLGGLVDRAELSGLGEAERAGFREVKVTALFKGRSHGLRREFRQVARAGDQFCAAREELRGSALVRLQVGFLVADDRVVGLADGGNGQRVRCRSVEDKEDITISFENFADAIAGPRSVRVRTVGRDIACICRFQGLPCLRANSCYVVAAEGVVIQNNESGKLVGRFWLIQEIGCLAPEVDRRSRRSCHLTDLFRLARSWMDVFFHEFVEETL